MVQELCELVVAKLARKSDESFLKEPFIEEIELFSSLRHIFVVIFRLEN